VFAPKNTARHFSEDHDYVVAYAKSTAAWLPTLLPRSAEADARYENPDSDPRGPWASSDLTARNYYSEGTYEVASPSGKKFKPTIGTYWRVKKAKFLELDRDGRISWGPDGDNMPRLKRFLSEVKQGIVPQTLWMHKDVGNTQEAKKELLQHVKFESTDNVLDTVKPTRLIQRMLQIATAPADGHLVLDFFSGSAPTAHAVLKQNRSDGGNRRFICVQLQEPLPKPERVLKTIADIGKQRIRSVAKALRDDKKQSLGFKDRDEPEDLGCKTFKLAESNYRSWKGVESKDGAAYAETMELFTDPLVPGWKPINVIYEAALKEGYGLTSTIEQVYPQIAPKNKDEKESAQSAKSADKNVVYLVTDADKGQSFRISLDDRLKDATVKALALKKDDLFICRDAALTDEQAANLALQCNLKTI
jgi:adenine-specific DNA-methyltransferase